jgi:hypothetical protein
MASAVDGDLAPFRRLVETPLLVAAGGAADPQAEQFFDIAQSQAAFCHDYPRPFSYADPPAIRRAAFERALASLDPRAFAPFTPGAWVAGGGFESADQCIEWPEDPAAGPPIGAATPLPDVPVMVLSGELDANTPTAAGRRVAARYPRATLIEIPNTGHHIIEESKCAAGVLVRFIRTLTAKPAACDGTSPPLPVAARPPVRAARLPLVRGDGTRVQRRALGLVAATMADLQEQAGVLQYWGAARPLRGGRYAAGKSGIRLARARVVRDASVSGQVVPAPRQLVGKVRLAGRGVANGRLRVRLSSTGRGRAAGALDGVRVDLAFSVRAP